MAKLPRVPASFYGIVLGLAGLGGAWRAASQLWGLWPIVGEALMVLAATVWLIVTLLYAAK